MPQHWCHFWGPRQEQQINRQFNFQWDIITKSSFVEVTACEGSGGDNGSNPPNRFIGLAQFHVNSIAPHDGGVTFAVDISGVPQPVLLWTDITVYDANDPSGQN